MRNRSGELQRNPQLSFRGCADKLKPCEAWIGLLRGQLAVEQSLDLIGQHDCVVNSTYRYIVKATGYDFMNN